MSALHRNLHEAYKTGNTSLMEIIMDWHSEELVIKENLKLFQDIYRDYNNKRCGRMAHALIINICIKYNMPYDIKGE